MAPSIANAQLIAALVNQGVEAPGGDPEWITRDADGNARVLSFSEMAKEDSRLMYGRYNETLGIALDAMLGDSFANAVTDAITDRYNAVVKNLNPQSEQPEQP